MPKTQRKARLLLKQKKATIVCYSPFTIQLLYATGETKQEIVLGVDYIIFKVNSPGKVEFYHDFFSGLLF
jgi:hypothetical protein